MKRNKGSLGLLVAGGLLVGSIALAQTSSTQQTSPAPGAGANVQTTAPSGASGQAGVSTSAPAGQAGVSATTPAGQAGVSATTPQSTSPQTSTPQSSQPQSSAPQTSTPQSTTTYTTTTQTTVPQSSQPNGTAPQTGAPGSTAYPSGQPASTVPGAVPSTGQPETLIDPGRIYNDKQPTSWVGKPVVLQNVMVQDTNDSGNFWVGSDGHHRLLIVKQENNANLKAMATLRNGASSFFARHRFWLIATAIVVAVILLAAFNSMRGDVLPVRSAHILRGSIRSVISTNGKIEPLNNFEAHSPVPTTVKRVLVKEGDHVKRGQLLLQLDDDEARTSAARALAQLKGAQADIHAVEHG